MVRLFGRSTPEVVFAVPDPDRLARAVAALGAADGRARWTAAPTPELLEAALRGRRALVVADPDFPRDGRLEPVLAEAVSLAAFLADPRGCLTRGRPQALGALPPGVYAVTGAVGGVGTTTAALGLARTLARGGPTLLLELPGLRRPPALPARGLGRDGAGLLLGEALPGPDGTGPTVLGVGGRVLREALRSRGEAALTELLRAAAASYRYVVLDLGGDLDPDLPGLRAGFVLTDPRPEGLAAARELAAAGTYEPVLVAPALSGAALQAGFALRLSPPPDPGRWGRALAGRLLRRL